MLCHQVALCTTFGGMKRLGLRSSLLSTEIKVDAGTEAPQTAEPQLFYDRVLYAGLIHIFHLISYQALLQ